MQQGDHKTPNLQCAFQFMLQTANTLFTAQKDLQTNLNFFTQTVTMWLCPTWQHNIPKSLSHLSCPKFCMQKESSALRWLLCIREIDRDGRVLLVFTYIFTFIYTGCLLEIQDLIYCLMFMSFFSFTNSL